MNETPRWIFPILIIVGYLYGLTSLFFDRIYLIPMTIVILIGCWIIYPKNIRKVNNGDI